MHGCAHRRVLIEGPKSTYVLRVVEYGMEACKETLDTSLSSSFGPLFGGLLRVNARGLRRARGPYLTESCGAGELRASTISYAPRNLDPARECGRPLNDLKWLLVAPKQTVGSEVGTTRASGKNFVCCRDCKCESLSLPITPER